jgi:hypothetical protein
VSTVEEVTSIRRGPLAGLREPSRARARAQHRGIDSAVTTRASRTGDERLARAVVLGCTIGVVAMTALVFAMGVMAGADPLASLGMGLFCAFWGGLGFGAMIGSVLVGSSEERRIREDGPDAPPSSGLWF